MKLCLFTDVEYSYIPDELSGGFLCVVPNDQNIRLRYQSENWQWTGFFLKEITAHWHRVILLLQLFMTVLRRNFEPNVLIETKGTLNLQFQFKEVKVWSFDLKTNWNTL